MRIAIGIAGAFLTLFIVWDAFEVMVLPRRVARRLRLVLVFFVVAWRPWRGVAVRVSKVPRRVAMLSLFGPLSILCLMILWASMLIVAFAMLQWAVSPPDGSGLNMPSGMESAANFGTYLYMSGTTFFTLGFGDITPRSGVGRSLAVLEAGLGFVFLAVVIGYLPVLYGAFSRREVNISMLDSRAGSPPTATELLCRHARGSRLDALERLLADWERWSAELLESHLSYPVLSYYRSQHNNQSWLSALVCILDACALSITTLTEAGIRCRWQAQLTFAQARHALIDLAQIYDGAPQFARLREKGDSAIDRLPLAELEILRRALEDGGIAIESSTEAEQRLAELRRSYEPYAIALSDYLLMSLPSWNGDGKRPDNWQTSKWTHPVMRGAVLSSTHTNTDADGNARRAEAVEVAEEEHSW